MRSILWACFPFVSYPMTWLVTNSDIVNCFMISPVSFKSAGIERDVLNNDIRSIVQIKSILLYIF